MLMVLSTMVAFEFEDSLAKVRLHDSSLAILVEVAAAGFAA